MAMHLSRVGLGQPLVTTPTSLPFWRMIMPWRAERLPSMKKPASLRGGPPPAAGFFWGFVPPDFFPRPSLSFFGGEGEATPPEGGVVFFPPSWAVRGDPGALRGGVRGAPA